MTGAAECEVKWCHEAGNHPVHRHYVASLPAWRAAWLIGVNVTQPAAQPVSVELTVTPRHGEPAIIPLEPPEAVLVAEALRAAAERAA